MGPPDVFVPPMGSSPWEVRPVGSRRTTTGLVGFALAAISPFAAWLGWDLTVHPRGGGVIIPCCCESPDSTRAGGFLIIGAAAALLYGGYKVARSLFASDEAIMRATANPWEQAEPDIREGMRLLGWYRRNPRNRRRHHRNRTLKRQMP